LLVLLGVAVASLPEVLHLPAPSESRGIEVIFVYLPAILAVVVCYSLDRTFSKKEETQALFLCVAFAFLTNHLHIWLVDLGHYFQGSDNLKWQLYVQKSVINLSPETIPHSYRFLTNSLVRLFEQVTGDFSVARDGYRNPFGVLLLYSLYRFARLF